MSISRFLFAILFAAATSVPAHAADRLVTVTGEASISIKPDTAVIRIGVSSQGKTAKAASETNAREMTIVLTAIKANGIDDRDIQTSYLSLQPQYDPNKTGTARLLGFQVINQLTVKIRDIDKLPALLDSAVTAGANEMSGIEFVVSAQSKLLDRVRAEAIADARRKAELYAHAAGVTLGHAVAITDEGAVSPYRPAALQTTRAGAVPIAPGEQTLRAALTVSYELTP